MDFPISPGDLVVLVDGPHRLRALRIILERDPQFLAIRVLDISHL